MRAKTKRRTVTVASRHESTVATRTEKVDKDRGGI